MSQTRQSGFVSLLTAILVSLLLIVITLSMVVLEVAQLRKASDSEQSMRAFYTAEAGVEDAVNKVLNNGLTTDQKCSDSSGNPLGGASQDLDYDTAGQAGWTCQQIAFSGAPTGRLDQANVATTVDPGAAPNYDAVLVEWDQSSGLSDTAPAVLPSQADYDLARFMPPLELTIIRYPQATVKASEICTGAQTPANTGNACKVLMQNAVLMPRGSAASGDLAYNDGLAVGAGPYAANCQTGRISNPYYASTTYHCYKMLTGFAPGNNYLFRLKSLYGASAYRLTFYNGVNKVAVPDGTATIDVTARAGDTYRRTITKVPVQNGTASGLDYVIFADTGVCKTFDVVGDVFPTGPSPTCQ